MLTLIIVLILAGIATSVLLVKQGKVEDKNNNLIPDAIEDKAEEIKEAVEKATEKVKKEVKEIVVKKAPNKKNKKTK